MDSARNGIKVCVVAGFEPLRVGLAEAIDGDPGMQVVHSASSLEELTYSDSYRWADVLLVDVRAVRKVAGQVGHETLHEWLPALRVLFVGSPDDVIAIDFDDIKAFFSSRALGFLLNGGSIRGLLQALHLTAAGTSVWDAGFLRGILTALARSACRCTPENDGWLLEWERDVLTLASSGHSDKEIARQLCLSQDIVKASMDRIMSKLALGSRLDLVRYALSNGLVVLDDEE